MGDIGLLVGTIIALLGIFIGIFLIMITHISNPIGTIKEDLLTIKQGFKTISEKPVYHSVDQFWATIIRESEFRDKLSIHRADKTLISVTIAEEYIKNRDIVIVDSGTTVDQIPHILREKCSSIRIYTNNLLAAISALPAVEGFDCILLPGKVDPIFGATYNIPNIIDPLKPIKATIIILAACAITYEEGPYVNISDISNLLFKQELVRKSLEDAESPILLIAVDWSKFKRISSINSNELNAVLEPVYWRTTRATKRFILVTNKPPISIRTPDAQEAREIIDRFMDNAKDNKGMTVRICSY